MTDVSAKGASCKSSSALSVGTTPMMSLMHGSPVLSEKGSWDHIYVIYGADDMKLFERAIARREAELVTPTSR